MNQRKLINRDSVLLWQGSAVSNIGNVLYSIAIGIWVYNTTGSTALMGIMTSVGYIVKTFLSPLSGALVDRMNRKKIICGTDLLRGFLMIIAAVFAFNNHLEVWMVIFIAFLSACCDTIFGPAIMTVLPQLVGKDDVIQASSINQGTNYLIQMVGSACSGFLVVFFGVPLMILINGISFIISSFTELFINIPVQKSEAVSINTKLILQDMKDGLHYITSRKSLFYFLIAAFLLNLFGAGMSAILYPWCLAKGLSIEQYGIYLGIESFAAIMGMVLVSVIKIKGDKIKLIRNLLVLTTILNIILSFTVGFFPLSGINAISAFCNTIFNAIINGVMVGVIAEQHRGKVFGLVNAYSCGGIALSTLMYGFISEGLGVVNTYILFAILSLIPTVLYCVNKYIPQLETENVQENTAN